MHTLSKQQMSKLIGSLPKNGDYCTKSINTAFQTQLGWLFAAQFVNCNWFTAGHAKTCVHPGSDVMAISTTCNKNKQLKQTLLNYAAANAECIIKCRGVYTV